MKVENLGLTEDTESMVMRIEMKNIKAGLYKPSSSELLKWIAEELLLRADDSASLYCFCNNCNREITG